MRSTLLWRASNLRLSLICQQSCTCNIFYKVKYLGSCPVTSDSGEEVTANAIKAILATAKRLEKKLARVEVVSSFASLPELQTVEIT